MNYKIIIHKNIPLFNNMHLLYYLYSTAALLFLNINNNAVLFIFNNKILEVAFRLILK